MCRVFHRATRALVFRHIGRLTLEKEVLLDRSLLENDGLRSHVQSCHLNFNYGMMNEDRLARILALPNIKELFISRSDPVVGNLYDVVRTAKVPAGTNRRARI